MNRELDGVYFRVKVDGKWENVCFSDLTEEQMREVLEGKSDEWLIGLTAILGTVINNLTDCASEVKEGNKEWLIDSNVKLGKIISELGDRYQIERGTDEYSADAQVDEN